MNIGWRRGGGDPGRSARRSMYTAAYRRHRRRRALGWVLAGLGVVVGGAHVVTHLGYFQVLPSLGLQDVVMGYPTAGGLVVAALVLLGGRSAGKA